MRHEVVVATSAARMRHEVVAATSVRRERAVAAPTIRCDDGLRPSLMHSHQFRNRAVGQEPGSGLDAASRAV